MLIKSSVVVALLIGICFTGSAQAQEMTAEALIGSLKSLPNRVKSIQLQAEEDGGFETLAGKPLGELQGTWAYAIKISNEGTSVTRIRRNSPQDRLTTIQNSEGIKSLQENTGSLGSAKINLKPNAAPLLLIPPSVLPWLPSGSVWTFGIQDAKDMKVIGKDKWHGRDVDKVTWTYDALLYTALVISEDGSVYPVVVRRAGEEIESLGVHLKNGVLIPETVLRRSVLSVKDARAIVGEIGLEGLKADEQIKNVVKYTVKDVVLNEPIEPSAYRFDWKPGTSILDVKSGLMMFWKDDDIDAANATVSGIRGSTDRRVQDVLSEAELQRGGTSASTSGGRQNFVIMASVMTAVAAVVVASVVIIFRSKGAK